MKVLLIEDDEMLAEAVSQILSRNSYSVDVSHDGESGLDCALSGIYDVILLDVMLPLLDGIGVLRQLRQEGIATPVIMLTAKGELRDKVHGLDCGADDYIAKPFETEELLARIRAVVRRTATKIFLDELAKNGDIQTTEFFFSSALPVFCTGCQLCMGNPREACPHAGYVTPIYDAIMESDALIFTTPHHGGCSMSSGMKALLDHTDFLTLNVAPREELFDKKAFIITTATGSTAAINPIRKFLKNWGVNRVDAIGLRMLTNRWDAMPDSRRAAFDRRLRAAARRFYAVPLRNPYLSTVLMYHMSKFILKRFVGSEAYPYKYWEEKGFFQKRPF